jgi:hypothetical protein
LSRFATHITSSSIKDPHLASMIFTKQFFSSFCLFKIAYLFKIVLIFFHQCIYNHKKNSSNLSSTTSLQSNDASKGQFLHITTSLSIFSTPKQHHHKLMSTPKIQNIHLVSIYELGMPIICCAKKVTFGNLNSLANHHITGSRPYAFSTWNLQNKVYLF